MIVIITSITVLFLLNLLLIFSLKRLNRNGKNENNEVNISIIIAAKNEAENISQLIWHLQNLDYPADKFEVILVDDNSSDKTLRLLLDHTESINNFSVFTTKSPGVSGKRDALTIGISKAKFSNLLITDADCYPENHWLKSYSKKFTDGFDFIFGIAPLYQHKNLVNRISCFEHLRSSIISFSMASFDLPYTAAARNFGFIKTAFDSLGGYSKSKDTKSGDDDLLLREAVKNKMKIGLVTTNGSFVYSETKKTFAEYFLQKARHTQTSFHYLIRHQIILAFWHSLNLFFLFSPILMFLDPLFGILLPLKLSMDFVMIISNQKKFSYTFSMFQIFYLQILYEILLIIHFLNARFTKIQWK